MYEPFEPEVLAKYAATIKAAEKDLGHLSVGQRSDLLLDNHSEILNSDVSHELVRAIEEQENG